MKSKIAFFVINHAAVGGVERVTSSLMTLFKQNNINVSSLISLGGILEKNPIIHFPITSIKCIERKKITSELSNFINANSITHLIFQGDNMSIALLILESLKKTTCKGFLHYHGSPFSYLKKSLYRNDIFEKPMNLFKIILSKISYPFRKNKLKRVVLQSEYFITVSIGAKKELINLFDTKFKHIEAIHNPTSFELKNEVLLSNKKKQLVFVSRLERKDKNAFLSIKAWQLIHHKYPDWNFIILGDGKLKNRMANFIVKNKIQNVLLLGQVNNVHEYLEKSAISILTSDSEGFGMGLYESIAFKNAIIATSSYGGVSDIIAHEKNGYLVAKNNSVELSEKMEVLIQDDNLREKMQIASFNKYKQFLLEDIVSQWRNLLQI